MILLLILTSLGTQIIIKRASLVTQMVKNLPATQETQVQPLHQEDPLKKLATHSSTLPEEFHGQRNRTGYSSWNCCSVRLSFFYYWCINNAKIWPIQDMIHKIYTFNRCIQNASQCHALFCDDYMRVNESNDTPHILELAISHGGLTIQI